MAVVRKVISLAWLIEQKACNLDALLKYFGNRHEIEITPEGLARIHQAGLLSCNWLARRILIGPELEEYEQECHKAMREFEEKMLPVLSEIISRAKPPS